MATSERRPRVLCDGAILSAVRPVGFLCCVAES